MLGRGRETRDGVAVRGGKRTGAGMISPSAKAARRLVSTAALGFVPLCVALALVACSSLPFAKKEEPKPVDENAFPSNYKNAILNLVRSTQSFDPAKCRATWFARGSIPATSAASISG
jgi:hypothetical protein